MTPLLTLILYPFILRYTVRILVSPVSSSLTSEGRLTSLRPARPTCNAGMIVIRVDGQHEAHGPAPDSSLVALRGLHNASAVTVTSSKNRTYQKPLQLPLNIDDGEERSTYLSFCSVSRRIRGTEGQVRRRNILQVDLQVETQKKKN